MSTQRLTDLYDNRFALDWALNSDSEPIHNIDPLVLTYWQRLPHHLCNDNLPLDRALDSGSQSNHNIPQHNSPMPTQKPAYQLCDNRSTLKKALTSLRSASTIIVDCEGECLGKQGGSLSIISLCPANTTNIFLIDVIKLHNSLSPLFDLLRSNSVVKVMFDGRMDFSALYHGFGVQLRNVIDLQLADVRSRQSRGENNVARVNRLSSFLNARHIALTPDLYAGAVKLSGLSLCIEEHLGLSGFKKSPVDHAKWLNRPLSDHYLSYAAADVQLMGLLYDEFLVKGYTEFPGLYAETMRYIELWKSRQPTHKDPYKGHPLLPLEILGPYSDSIRRECSGCERSLSQSSFQGNSMRCRICKIIKKRGFVNTFKNRKKLKDSQGKVKVKTRR